ncbi:hypothetical protein WMF31_01935 [Sorangium sp. So ce1036]|uniref:hypothetical protein n=1 Tax=Sorangium sp. So ce1036 TaxID=3133328 RepID=UPI003EFC1066
MKRIKLKLHSDEYHLSAVGFLFEGAAPEEDPAGVKPFSIRNTVFPEFDLEPGDYVFRFRVRNGSGKFQILALDPKTNQSTRADFDTANGAEGLTFKFTVTP